MCFGDKKLIFYIRYEKEASGKALKEEHFLLILVIWMMKKPNSQLKTQPLDTTTSFENGMRM